MIKRLRRRFIRIAMLSVTLVMLLLTLIVNVANYSSLNADLCKTLELIEQNKGTIPLPLRRDTAADGETPSMPEKRPEGQGGHDGPFGPETPFSTRFFVLRYTADGTLVNAELDKIAAVTEDDVDAFLAVALRHGVGFGYCTGYKYLISDDGEGRFSAIFLDCYQELRTFKAVALWSAAADAVCIVLVYLLVVLFSRRAIDPVVRSAEQQKQFITDASHELKTPLTVISTSLSVLEMEVGEQKWINKARAQTAKMGELVGALVTLSRMDEEEPPVVRADFDLSAAVEETAESFRESAQAHAHLLELTIEPSVFIHGDEAMLRQLVSILLDNAIKYARPGGVITLSLRTERHAVVLQSGNPCAPMTQEETQRLFDRFYRPDSSRTAATGGFGVGLSIARGIAQAHGGSIEAQYAQDTGIVFTLRLKKLDRRLN